jgi:hypothetical protein
MYEKNTIKVSQKFIEIYRNFNVSDQREKMNELSKEELYLLLDSCVDNHDEDDTTVTLNFSPFYNELKDILKIQSGDEVDNNILKELQKSTDFRLSSDRVSESGDKLPSTYTRDQVRELKLNKIFDK